MRTLPLRRRSAVVGLVLAAGWAFAARPAETATPTPTVAPTPATPIPCGEAVPPLCAGGDCGGGISSCQPDPSGLFCLCEPPTPSPAAPTATASPRLDHFTCYDTAPAKNSVKFPGIPNPPGVSLVDQFGSSTVEVKRSSALCNPADKNDENPGAELHAGHLKSYPIKNALEPKPAFPGRILVVDQFNPQGILLDATRQSHLLVPAVTSLDTTPPTPSMFTIDHFECYGVTPTPQAPRFAGVRGLSVKDGFGVMTVDVKRPKSLCNPVSKNGEAVRDPGSHLLCYRIVQVDRAKFMRRGGLLANDQFGPETLDVKRPTRLCVPALTNPIMPADLVGTYDYQDGGPALGVIRQAASALVLTIEFQPGTYIQAALDIGLDGSVTFSGQAVEGGDMIAGPASGVGTATMAGAVTQIAGTVTSTLVGGTVPFTMSRPISGTPPGLGGSYVFTFVGLSDGVPSSSATLVLAVPSTGIGQSTQSADETDTSGNVLGRFSPGECLVSPQGKLSCRLPYAHQVPPPPSFPIPSFNAQIAGSFSLGGTVYGDTPPIPHAFPIASWTASHLPGP